MKDYADKSTWPAFVIAALDRLERDLPNELCYHDIRHTMEVIDAALLLGAKAGLFEPDMELLLIAAVFHDSGFLLGRMNHEQAGAEMAAEAMKNEKCYSPEDIRLVSQMILDTRLVSTPAGRVQVSNSRLSPYLLDADLSHFGDERLPEKSRRIFEENRAASLHDFNRDTLSLLEAHRWQSPEAEALWAAAKAKNLERLRRSLNREG